MTCTTISFGYKGGIYWRPTSWVWIMYLIYYVISILNSPSLSQVFGAIRIWYPQAIFWRWRCLGDLVPSPCMLLMYDRCPCGSNSICRFSCMGGKHCLGSFAGYVGSGLCCCCWRCSVAVVVRWWTCHFVFFGVTSKFQVESCLLESRSPGAVMGRVCWSLNLLATVSPNLSPFLCVRLT